MPSESARWWYSWGEMKASWASFAVVAASSAFLDINPSPNTRKRNFPSQQGVRKEGEKMDTQKRQREKEPVNRRNRSSVIADLRENLWYVARWGFWGLKTKKGRKEEKSHKNKWGKSQDRTRRLNNKFNRFFFFLRFVFHLEFLVSPNSTTTMIWYGRTVQTFTWAWPNFPSPSFCS